VIDLRRSIGCFKRDIVNRSVLLLVKEELCRQPDQPFAKDSLKPWSFNDSCAALLRSVRWIDGLGVYRLHVEQVNFVFANRDIDTYLNVKSLSFD